LNDSTSLRQFPGQGVTLGHGAAWPNLPGSPQQEKGGESWRRQHRPGL